MTAFVREKLTYIAAQRAARREQTHRLYVLAGENVYTLDRLLRNTRDIAVYERNAFADYFGEQLPGHARDALDVEIQGWERLEESLDQFREAEPNSKDLSEYSRNVQRFLAIQMDILRLEEELVQSCLVAHYDQLIKRFWNASIQVPL